MGGLIRHVRYVLGKPVGSVAGMGKISRSIRGHDQGKTSRQKVVGPRGSQRDRDNRGEVELLHVICADMITYGKKRATDPTSGDGRVGDTPEKTSSCLKQPGTN